MRCFVFFILSAASIFFAGCDSKMKFSAEKKIPNAQWLYRDTVAFSFPVTDTLSLYNIYLELGSNNQFASQNIYLQLHTTFPDGRRESLVKSFDIFDVQGKMIGDRSGNKAKQRIILQENAFFNKAGNYTITFEQFMRRDTLPGIETVGLAVEQQGQRTDAARH